MNSKYQPKQFESKWIKKWDTDKIYQVENNTLEKQKSKSKKQYVLAMFPYPSGAGLHVGHVRVYSATDVIARYYRMNGKQVLHPMGWDAFGLPAENAAIKAKINPIDMVPEHIATFKKQMMSLGFSYDWDREFATTSPDYYRWTQWLFIQFYKMGLLYKKNTPINFCPFCKTGCSEEEILQNGTHERCGNKIEKRDMPQWLFKITSYADRLLKDLNGLDWPKGILEMQRNWIGKKVGINIEYLIFGIQYSITCFTTRPDTNFGATFIVVAPEHEFVNKILSGELKVEEKIKKNIHEYVEKAKAKTQMEREAEGKKKTGVFTEFYAINNLNDKKIPIWISDFALMNFGTGAVIGVPGHDMRDFEFAQEFGIEVIRVVVGIDGDKSPIKRKEQVQEEEGVMINSEFLNGIKIQDAIKKMMDYAEENGWGKRVVTYHLRDWIFSRQRYWGEPIPMIECKKCGWMPLPESELPLKLPYVKSYEPTDTGESPLSRITEWVKTTCPTCKGPAKRETDTMPNWAGSCWYFLRFADPKNDNKPWDSKLMDQWQPVDWYIGGAEHAVLHLLYSRFWVKALYDLKLLNFTEPFLRLRNVGMIIAEDSRKMSKSFGNVINPDDVIKEYGADALRIYEMFMAPFSQEIAWSTSSLQGSFRFINRVWNLFHKDHSIEDVSDKQLAAKLQKTIAKVTEDIPETKFNTAVAAMMEFINEWEGKTLSKEHAKQFLQILAPFAPFLTEEIWYTLFKETTSIHLSEWPKVNKKFILAEVIQIPVQINGKVRAVIELDGAQTLQEIVEKKALQNEHIQKYIEGKKYKVIYVKGKIINIVLLS